MKPIGGWRGGAVSLALVVTGCTSGDSGRDSSLTTDTDSAGSASGKDTTGGEDTGDGGTSGASTSSGDTGASDDGGPRLDVYDPPDPDGSSGCTKADFLFVIDISGSMSQEQAALRAAYPEFMQKIQSAGIKDYHVAVTTTDMGSCTIENGDKGAFQWQPVKNDPACVPIPKKFIEGPSANAVAEFQCIAELFGGSAHEQPLQAGYSALVERIQDGTNPLEFRRPDALLIVVFITDEDDQSGLQAGNDNCAEKEIALYSQLYEQAVLKGNATAGVFIAISGPETLSCTGASAAPRLHEFINYWGTRGHWSSVCEEDLSTVLESALDTIEFGCEGFDPEG